MSVFASESQVKPVFVMARSLDVAPPPPAITSGSLFARVTNEPPPPPAAFPFQRAPRWPTRIRITSPSYNVTVPVARAPSPPKPVPVVRDAPRAPVASILYWPVTGTVQYCTPLTTLNVDGSFASKNFCGPVPYGFAPVVVVELWQSARLGGVAPAVFKHEVNVCDVFAPITKRVFEFAVSTKPRAEEAETRARTYLPSSDGVSTSDALV